MPRRSDEPVRLTRIYTRAGDAGETSLGDGSRVSKLDGRIAAYGTVDELNAQIGVVLAGDCPHASSATLSHSSRTSCSTSAPISPCRSESRGACGSSRPAVDRLEELCDRFNEPLQDLKSFVLPGGTLAAAALHVARTVCRRAEREAIAAAREHDVNPLVARLPEPALRPALHSRPERERGRRRRRAALAARRHALSRGAWRLAPGSCSESLFGRRRARVRSDAQSSRPEAVWTNRHTIGAADGQRV